MMPPKPCLPPVLFAAVGGLAVLSPAPVQAATTDDFEGGTTGNTFVLGAAPSAGVPGTLPGGPTGDFFRLIQDGDNSQNNHLNYDLTDPGAFSNITASFDYRVTNTGLPADGFSIQFLPTSIYGTTGDGPNVTAEEPNIGSTLAFGFDAYNEADGVNDFSVHWNGSEIVNVRPDPVTEIDHNAGVFHRVDIELGPVGNSTSVNFMVTPDIHGTPGTPVSIYQGTILGLSPYENRIQFAARTGGANMSADFDNLAVTYANPSSLPDANAAGLFQDFDSAGTTSANTVVQGTAPGAVPVVGDAGSTGAFLRLVNDGVNDQKNTLIFDRAQDGGITNKPRSIEFDFRMGSVEAPADGFGFFVLPTQAFGSGGTAGAVNPAEPEQAGVAGTLHVGFDTYPDVDDLVFTIDGTELARVPAGVDFDANQFHNARVDLTPGDGGMNVAITLTPDVNGTPGAAATPIDVFVPGLVATDYRVQFTGRTGGLNTNVDLDNIRSTTGALAATPSTTQNFDNGGFGGSGFVAYSLGAGLKPEFVENGGNAVLRLLHDGSNNSVNGVAFDQAADGVITTSHTGIVAEFDMRAESIGAAAADGFSMRFVPTSIYGTEGPGIGAFEGNVGTAEEPNIASVLAIAFDLHPAGEVNDASIHWDGSELLNVTLSTVDLDDGGIHDVEFEWRETPEGSELDFVVGGETVASGLAVPGLELYDYRVEFFGRTGGLNVTVDIDNLSVRTIPEPSATVLAGLLGGLLALRRRRRGC